MATQQATAPSGMLATWRLYWRMTRPGFLSITAVGCALGLASAAACGCGFDGVRAGITVLLALLAHAGANVLNDYCDEVNGADAANTGALFPFTGGSRFIQSGHPEFDTKSSFFMDFARRCFKNQQLRCVVLIFM